MNDFSTRCRLAQECLPDAEYRRMLTALHSEMLAALRESALLVAGAAGVLPDPEIAAAQPAPVPTLLPEPTYTHKQVRAMLDDISKDARRFGLEVVDYLNGHIGLRANTRGVEGSKP